MPELTRQDSLVERAESHAAFKVKQVVQNRGQ
jgi:hypothetical protein